MFGKQKWNSSEAVTWGCKLFTRWKTILFFDSFALFATEISLFVVPRHYTRLVDIVFCHVLFIQNMPHAFWFLLAEKALVLCSPSDHRLFYLIYKFAGNSNICHVFFGMRKTFFVNWIASHNGNKCKSFKSADFEVFVVKNTGCCGRLHCLLAPGAHTQTKTFFAMHGSECV